MSTKTLGASSFSTVPDVLGVPVLLATPGAGLTLQEIFSAVAAQSGTPQVALNNTTPTQASSGTQIWSQSITPKTSTSDILITGTFLFNSSNNGRQLVVTVFRGSVCVGVTFGWVQTSGKPTPVSLEFSDTPASTSAQTYSVYVGMTGGGTWYVAQSATAAYFNGMLAKSNISLKEIS